MKCSLPLSKSRLSKLQPSVRLFLPLLTLIKFNARMKSRLPNKAHVAPTITAEISVMTSRLTVNATEENLSVKSCQLPPMSTVPVAAEMIPATMTAKKLYEKYPASESNSPFFGDVTPSAVAILSAIKLGAARIISDKYFSISNLL